MHVTKLTCHECGLAHEGEFYTPRIARLGPDDERFAELFIMASGSLKKMAEVLGVSYPTVRGRLDNLIERLQQEKQRDQTYKQQVLEQIESGQISAKHGMRLIEAL